MTETGLFPRGVLAGVVESQRRGQFLKVRHPEQTCYVCEQGAQSKLQTAESRGCLVLVQDGKWCHRSCGKWT